MTDLVNLSVTVTLSFYEARAVKSAAWDRAKRAQRRQETTRFEPAPGHLNLSILKLATLSSAHAKLGDAMTAALEEAKHKEETP